MKKPKLKPITGWALITKDDDGEWYICWDGLFATRKYALQFTVDNKWPVTDRYRAIRASIVATANPVRS